MKHNISKFNTWKKSLSIAGIEFSNENLYFANIDKIDTSCKTKYSLSFYIGRYSWLYDDEIVNTIYQKNRNFIINNRINPYNPIEVAKKKGISLEEANKLVNNLKSLTSGTIDNFIKRYGEKEGLERFKEFSKKSSHSLETFIKKHGEEYGEIKYKDYLKSKSSSLEAQMLRYGKQEGEEKYTTANIARGKAQTLEGYIEKYGEDGHKKYKLNNRKKCVNLDALIQKYGKEEGQLRHNAMCIKRSHSSSLNGYIEKYGKEEGEKKYKLKCIHNSPIFAELRKKYKYETALKIYLSGQSKKYETAKTAVRTKIKSSFNSKIRSKGPTSKQSNEFFTRAENILSLKLNYGSKSAEFNLFDEINNSKYFYDAYCGDLNLLIEFHGITYHPKEGNTEWVNPWGKTYEEILNKDRAKRDAALNAGYEYLELWSDDTLSTNIEKLKNKINQIHENKNN